MKKDILSLFVIVLIVVLLINGVKIQSPEEYYLIHIDDITPESKTVSLEINCSSILDNYQKLDDNLRNEKYVPSSGVILECGEYVLRNGDTVLSILDRVTRHNKIQMEYQGADKNNLNSAYVYSINYIYEFSCGQNSGWTFTVNGVYPKLGCSEYVLQDGDRIEWIFTCSSPEVSDG